ncbi:MAG: hypothetical protein ACRD2C_02015 [Acidimicrobiales bacterium]
MSHLPFSDREIERVLAGQQPYGRPELAEVAYFVARLRALMDFEPAPEMNPELRAQVEAAEARQAAKGGGRRQRAAPRPRVVAPAAVSTGDIGVVELDARRPRPRKGRGRWRLVGAAAAAVLAGGILTASLQTGSEPEVETETIEPGQSVTATSVEVVAPDVTEPPAASSGEPSERPTGVSTPPPDTQVDTSEVPPPQNPAEQPPEEPEPTPSWAEDYWPSECDWRDWECACEQYSDDHGDGDCWDEHRRDDDR